ncbi:succinylglutamate desuccinylase [Photobacterium kishitanii]|uniref:Succinylglutamate desuccinylase n=1 Tax=Photobacterium kishitanii TaxID=318456 RepID=A0A0B7J8R1_9GAMM|nr:succinylglutamate desuccinylase [Photobacterium kishitanii]OBU28995.1 succinylglutamate desuccinylase [Photobacterium kishitanii]PSU92118.1 succinylglutamate desuccinylase [Photobacterium kishitanii]PSU96786.1 succinylglutamate desuccinylase [Photobacterium kishitanii]PSU96955.1 succinylglutamate desuccinylase [Photobacterium kishitanii]PSV12309.1 succinylglutamate desuccinylase [Photobacterium kishitanii]
MTLIEQIKRGQFLKATCDFSQPFVTGEWVLDSGLHCQLLYRGVLQITPRELASDTKDIVLSCGVHGDETSPIELVQQIASGVVLGQIQPVHRLLLIIAHPEAINHQQRFMAENMNRLFQVRNFEKNNECRIANALQLAINSFYGTSIAIKPERWHLDLHCAIRPSQHDTFAISPYTDKQTRSNKLFSFIHHAKLDAVLLSNKPSPTFAWYSAEYHGAQALTVELGRVGKLGHNDFTVLAPFRHAILQLITDVALPIIWTNEVEVYQVSRTIVKRQAEFYFTFNDDVANFTFFAEGDEFAVDGSQTYTASVGGEAVVFPNRHVVVGQRAVLMVKKANLIFDEQVRVCAKSNASS